MPYFYFDYTYLLLLPALIFALWAQARVQSSYNKYNKVMTRSGMTGADAARMILDANGLTNVRIEQIAGNLTDHFDPKANVIRLSNAVYGSRGVAALGVAAHEAGHAVQYAENYSPMRLRASIIGITNIGSRLALPIFLIGLLFSYELALIGIALFSLTAVFQAVTLPVEFNASRRALEALDGSGRLDDDELKGAKKVLTAAALTYVAALASSLAQILRLLIIAGGRRRD
ncbi:MAG: zinc metallopeptidase [Ruminococcaceae bacterium]|nr:zinc metallopeptidase [Oscillospiraceae bacterium]